jgi:crotonobetainyl-CoA:carnitine CoA-transferase CaiB-like acyl-CoA transferase
MGHVYLEAAVTGVEPTGQGNHSDDAVPHNVYPSAGDDRWVAIAVHDDTAWQRLVAAVGWDADASLDQLAGRLAARDAIDKRLAEWTAAQTREEAAERLQAAGVSAMPVMGPIDHHADPHLTERAFIVELEHAEVGAERQVGNPIRFSSLEQRTAVSAPLLGEHTEEVLEAVLGIPPERTAELRESGVCR